MPAGKVLAVVLLSLGLASLLNVQSLRAAAERQPGGLTRDVALVLVWPLEGLSDVLGLDEPRLLVDRELLGRGQGGFTPQGAPVTGEAGGPPAGDAAGVIADQPALPVLAQLEAIPPEALAPAREAVDRQFSAADPLRIWVIGDSLTEQLGPALRDATATLPTADTQHDFHYSSGLTRPDFFDWHAQVAHLITEHDPDAWVVLLGGNDAQDIRTPEGRFVHLGEPVWEATYRDRVGRLMDALTAAGRGVLWVGQPIMRDAEFDERMTYLNAIYAAEAAERPAVAFLATHARFATPEGRYADYLPAADGQLVLMRLSDGIHLTRAGGDRLAGDVLASLEAQWGLTEASAGG